MQTQTSHRHLAAAAFKQISAENVFWHRGAMNLQGSALTRLRQQAVSRGNLKESLNGLLKAEGRMLSATS
jgi:hypothetical protein